MTTCVCRHGFVSNPNILMLTDQTLQDINERLPSAEVSQQGNFTKHRFQSLVLYIYAFFFLKMRDMFQELFDASDNKKTIAKFKMLGYLMQQVQLVMHIRIR